MNIVTHKRMEPENRWQKILSTHMRRSTDTPMSIGGPVVVQAILNLYALYNDIDYITLHS